MNSDEVLADLDAQYQELIQSVQSVCDGLDHDQSSEPSSNALQRPDRKINAENVSEIIGKYEQTLQTSREFYEAEIKKLGSAKKRAEIKYVECRKQWKASESKIAQISDVHKLQIDKLSERKDAEIKELKELLSNIKEQSIAITEEHSKCTESLSAKHKRIETLQRENSELSEKYIASRVELDTLTEMLSTKKTELEKCKVELIQTRQSMDEQTNEMKEIQQQLQECRDEINFLCTTNEDLQNTNDRLSKKLEKYPQANSLLNSEFLGDDRSEVSNDTVISTLKKKYYRHAKAVPSEPLDEVQEHKETKGISPEVREENDEVTELGSEDTNANTVITECPKLRTAKSIFMLENVEDSKIKQELHRLESDRVAWNVQLDEVSKQRDELLRRNQDQQGVINDLRSQLTTIQETEGQIVQQQQQVDMKKIAEIEQQCHKLLQEQQQEYECRLQEYVKLTAVQKQEIQRLTEKLADQSPRNSADQSLHEKHTNDALDRQREQKIAELTSALNRLQDDNENANKKWEHIINEYRNKAQQSEQALSRLTARYEHLSEEYRTVQQQYHDTKLAYNQLLTKEEEYKSQIQQNSVNLKFALQELQQHREQLSNERKTNAKHTEEIGQLNHDIKQLHAELETARMQMVHSQHLVQSLEKQLLTQTQTLQNTRNQLQLQMQLNMQNLAALNTQKNMQNDLNEDIRQSTQILSATQNVSIPQPEYIPSAMKDASQPTGERKSRRRSLPETFDPHEVPKQKVREKPQNRSVDAAQSDMMELARGRPLWSRSNSQTNSTTMQSRNGKVRNNVTDRKLRILLEEKQKLESDLFKLPTNLRSLQQRKRKQAVESALREVEGQIASIKHASS